MPILLVLIGLVSFALPLQQSELAPTGSLRAAFISNNPVQGRVNPQTGAVTGPVGDIVAELGKRLGVPYTIFPADSPEEVIEAVKTRKVDIGFVTINPERAKQVDFSDPYVISASAYLVRADSKITHSREVDQRGLTIGSIKGQTQQLYVSENMKQARVVVLPEAPTPAAIARLIIDGKVDVFAANRQRMEEAAQASPGVRVLADNFMTTDQAIAVEQGQSSRLAVINKFLADVKGSGFVRTSLDRANVAGVEVAP